ncbi:MAG: tetratricopeptide repeat protein [Desulfosalsimonadaceae bacterium]
MPLLTEDIRWSQISNQQFLFARTDTPADPDLPDATAPEPTDPGEISSTSQLKQKFPFVLSGEAFSDAAITFVADAESFAAAVVRIDNVHHVIHPNHVMTILAVALDKLCKKASGMWGIVGHNSLGCFFPGKNEKKCLAMLQALKQHLAGKCTETVSVGLAAYPILTYDKRHILGNARKALDHADFFGPNSCVAFDAVSLNISGDKLYQAGDVKGAMNEFRMALTLDKDNVNVHNSLGVCYGIKEDLDNALNEFKTAIRLAPKEIMAMYNAGYVYFLKKEYSTALDYFLKAERIDSTVFELAIQTGRIYLELNQPENAKKHLENAATLNPKSAAAFRLLGDTYTLLDRIADATTAYKTSLKLNPENAEALSALGYLYEMQAKNAEIALMFCSQAIGIDPENGLFHHRLGRLYLNRKQVEAALDAFQKAKELGYPSDEYIAKTLKMIASDG